MKKNMVTSEYLPLSAKDEWDGMVAQVQYMALGEIHVHLKLESK